MNDTLYEEYMRSVLGYQPMNNYQNTYYNNYDNLDKYLKENCAVDAKYFVIKKV